MVTVYSGVPPETEISIRPSLSDEQTEIFCDEKIISISK